MANQQTGTATTAVTTTVPPPPPSTVLYTQTLTDSDGTYFNPILATPSGVNNAAGQWMSDAMISVGTPSTVVTKLQDGATSKDVVELVTLATDYDAATKPTATHTVTLGTSPLNTIKKPRDTSTTASTLSSSSSVTLMTNTSSSAVASADPENTQVQTYTDLYVFIATISTATTSNGVTVAPYKIWRSVSTPTATSTKTTQDAAGNPTQFPVLVTTSTQYTTGKDGKATPVGTTVQSVGTPYPTRVSKGGGGGLSSGAGVGIGIGSAIIGALIALALFFLLGWRKPKPRSRRRHNSRGPSSEYDRYPLPESKAPVVTATSIEIPADSSAAVVHNNIPQPKDDATIMTEFSRLKTSIDNHVQNYYLRSAGDEDAAFKAYPRAIGEGGPIPANRLSVLLADPRSRPQALRAAIAWFITERISPSAGPAESFLPADVAASYAGLANGNRLDLPTRSAFLSEWRVMTATLSQSHYGQESLSANDPRTASIQDALGKVDLFLAPLASPADPEARKRNLEEIFKRSARLGWTLFSQPSEFRTDWDNEVRQAVVVFPGLLQFTDENGKILRHPRVFGEKEFAPF